MKPVRFPSEDVLLTMQIFAESMPLTDSRQKVYVIVSRASGADNKGVAVKRNTASMHVTDMNDDAHDFSDAHQTRRNPPGKAQSKANISDRKGFIGWHCRSRLRAIGHVRAHQLRTTDSVAQNASFLHANQHSRLHIDLRIDITLAFRCEKDKKDE